MHPFQSVMIICIAAFLMIAALFLMIWRIPRINLGIIWWFIASILLACSYLLRFILFDSPSSLAYELTLCFLAMISALATYIGCMRFLNQPIHCLWTATTLIFTFFLVVVLRSLHFHFFSDVVFSIYSFILFSLMAWRFYKAKDELYYIKRILTLCLVITSIHLLNYPWINHIAWFSPICFLISLLLNTTVYCLLASLVILQFKLHITESKHRANHAAKHDSLTGLLNRNALQQTFQKIKHQSFFLLYLDLDGFKYINDTYGHKAGDYVLIQTAKRLCAHIQNHTAEVARVGGDEFIILLSNEQEADIQTFTKQLLKILESAIHHHDETYNISASIGISSYPQHGNNLSELIGAADQAMYKAKHNGANDFCLATNLT